MNEENKFETDIHRAVKILLNLHGYRQYDLAAHLGITPTSLSAKLNGRNRFSAPEIRSMASFLEVSSDQLLGLQPLTVEVD